MAYSFTPADTASLALFISIVLVVIAMLYGGARRVGLGRPMLVFLTVWIATLSAVVESGWLREHIVPGVPLVFGAVNLGALILSLGPWGKKLASLPLIWLVIFQGFRLPLEIVLHLWAGQGTIPETLTWTGQNFDIVSGILACLALFKPLQTRAYAWLFNIVGFTLLLNVMRVVVLSSPLPFSWPLADPLQLIFYLPYALIGFVCVWAALAGHIVLTRALLNYRR